jgi:LysR family glycine cleavage system transcriptional activator
MVKPQRLPPIQYLVAFATAARVNSFKLAAEELNVTPSAISQQIKNLEEYLGLVLFSREKRVLKLTHAGEGFYKVAERTLHQYEKGFADFSSQYLSPILKVSMIPYVANEIVIPNLHSFQKQYPNIKLIIETSTQLEDIHAGELDGAIRFGTAPWQNLQADLICSVTSGLVASNDYLANNPINRQQDWAQQILIHSRSEVNDWQRYMQDTGYHFEPKSELFFDSYDAAIRAAEEGLGIVIAGLPLSQHKVESGALSLLFNRSVPLKESLYLVTKENGSKQESYQCLLDWLKRILSTL